MRLALRLAQIQSEFGFQTASLFFLDGMANITDFAFHFWMGRVLIPADFAILQTLNSVVLVYVTASGVFQPVVGRFVAEARGKSREASIPAIFRTYLRAAFWLGFLLGLLMFTFSNGIARLLNLPAWTIQISALVVFLSTLRPIAIGMLQGQERFIPFGISRLLTALGRLILSVALVKYGLALTGAVIAIPFGWLVGVFVAFTFLGPTVWRKSEALPQSLLYEGWKLSFYALLGYLAYMSLTSLDLVWVNRTFPGEQAGAYASLVVLRRVVALLPGVAVTVMFPRLARELTAGTIPDRLLIRTAALIVAASGALTILYFAFGNALISIIFGNAYLAAANLLGWMGIAMIGISLSSVWLNFFLAYQPRSFVILLAVSVALEWFFLYLLPASLPNAILAFGASAWLLTLGGLILYLFNVRPALHHAHA